MSGGSLNYIYINIEELADHFTDPEMRALVFDLSSVIHDLEWYESGDISKNELERSIREFKRKFLVTDRNERLKEYIDASCNSLKENLYSMIDIGESDE